MADDTTPTNRPPQSESLVILGFLWILRIFGNFLDGLKGVEFINSLLKTCSTIFFFWISQKLIINLGDQLDSFSELKKWSAYPCCQMDWLVTLWIAACQRRALLKQEVQHFLFAIWIRVLFSSIACWTSQIGETEENKLASLKAMQVETTYSQG